MRFAHPLVLVYLVIPAVAAAALVAAIFVRRRKIAAVGTPSEVEAQLKRPSPYLRAAAGIALIAAMALTVVAAARPQYGGRVEMVKKKGIDIVVALDFSKSMLAQDVSPDRLRRAKLELDALIDRLGGDRLGLVAFAGDTIRFPLTSDYQAAKMFWKDLTPNDMPVGGTAIARAITAGVDLLHSHRDDDDEAAQLLAHRAKVLIVLTDGEDHVGDPIEAAKEAHKRGVRIYTVGIGSDSPELIPRYLDDGTPAGYLRDKDGNYVTTALTAKQEKTLKEIAAITGGTYIRAGRDLGGVAALADELHTLKQSTVAERQTVVYEEVYQWFLIPAALLLLAAYVIPERRRRRS